MGFVFFDNLKSFISGLGTARDKSASVEYVYTPLMPNQLWDMYRSAWMPRKIVEIPADDATRRWRDWQAKEDQIKLLEAEEKRLGVRQKVRQAIIYARLYGGCALLIGDGASDPSQPLDPESIKKGGLKYLTVVPRIQCSAGDIGQDPTSERYNLPLYWNVGGSLKGAIAVHPSRLVIFLGNGTGQDMVTDGWGDSVLQAVYTAVRNADSAFANVASLIFEAKVDVLRIPNFMNSLADPEYSRRLTERARLAMTGKGINGTLMLDKEEEYEQKEVTFGSLPDVMDRFTQFVCGAADIPATRFMSQAPAGMNSTGESDLRNYYDGVTSVQTNDIEPAMAILDECLIRSALGSRDEDIWYSWGSLWQVSAVDAAVIGERSANTISLLSQTGLFPPEALSEAGANMLVERGVMPGLEQSIADAPEFDPAEADELEKEAARKALKDPPKPPPGAGA